MKPFRRAIILTADTLGQTWAGIPGIEVTPAGRLFVVCFSGGLREPAPENTVYLVISNDGGGTFGPPVVMAAPRDGARAFDPTLWIDPLGRLWLIFNRGNKDTAEHGVYARLCADPDAAELGWNEATQINGAYRSVFNLDVSRDGIHWERKYRFETDKSFQYPTLREYEGAIYLTVTQGDYSDSRKERIMFGRLENLESR